MHTTATPEKASATPVAVLEGSQFSALEETLAAPIFPTSAPPEHPLPDAVAPQRAEPDSGKWDPELIDTWYEEYLARHALDEMLERGALAALFG